MQDIVNEISKFNILPETLVRMTYLKTVYSCPTQAEREFVDYDYEEEHHHHYRTDKHVVILSVYGVENANDQEWRNSTIDGDILRAKIHKRFLKFMLEHIATSGFYQADFNHAVYEDNHYQMTILSIEKLN
tara:strand:+ start:611 stop:1003 length:393 start_codon:yes stop_codon:yes gene_type:complete